MEIPLTDVLESAKLSATELKRHRQLFPELYERLNAATHTIRDDTTFDWEERVDGMRQLRKALDENSAVNSNLKVASADLKFASSDLKVASSDLKVASSDLKVASSDEKGHLAERPSGQIHDERVRSLLKHFTATAAHGIRRQICDTRTAVVREACGVLSAAAKALGKDAEGVMLAAYPSLLRRSAVSVSSFSLSSTSSQSLAASHSANALHAVQLSLQLVRSSFFPPMLIAFAFDKNAPLRYRAAQHSYRHLAYMILQYESVSLLPFVEDIDSALYQLAGDAKQTVKHAAAECFQQYRAKFPEQSQRFIKRIGPKMAAILTIENPRGLADYFPTDEPKQRPSSAKNRPTTAESRPQSAKRPSSAKTVRPSISPKKDKLRIPEVPPYTEPYISGSSVPVRITNRPKSAGQAKSAERSSHAFAPKPEEKSPSTTDVGAFRPSYGVYETADAVSVVVDLPGVRREHVSYELLLFGGAGGRKAIRITAMRDPDLCDGAICHEERRPLGRTEVSIDLPKCTLFDKSVSTSLENGVYRVQLCARLQDRLQIAPDDRDMENAQQVPASS